MKRFAAVRFVGALAANERDAVSRVLGSVGATVTSWNGAAGRTYARIERPALDASDDEVRSVVRDLRPDAELSSPPLAVLRVSSDGSTAELASALTGPGRPLGVVASVLESDGENDAVVIEIDVRITPLSTIVAVVDAVSRGARRRIEPILPLEDEPLTELASARLGDPAIDATRLIETWLEPLLARTRP